MFGVNVRQLVRLGRFVGQSGIVGKKVDQIWCQRDIRDSITLRSYDFLPGVCMLTLQGASQLKVVVLHLVLSM